jgi:hypothetical protein
MIVPYQLSGCPNQHCNHFAWTVGNFLSVGRTGQAYDNLDLLQFFVGGKKQRIACVSL